MRSRSSGSRAGCSSGATRGHDAALTSRAFGRFACIDWSGARGGPQRGIALALCVAGDAAPRPVPPSDAPHWTREAMLRWIAHQAAEASDLLIGMDLSMSLPFADAGAFFPGHAASPVSARALWRLVDTMCARDAHLGIDGFVDDPGFAPHFRRHGGREGAAFGGGGGRLRVVERRPGSGTPASGFNLVGAKQVGRASLAGMRLLHRLDGAVPVWPFDPLPDRGPAIVEIYAGIAARAAGRPPGRSKIRDAAALDMALERLVSDPHAPLARYDDHLTDAIVGAAWLRRAAADATLWRPAGWEAVRMTEGWTFGVG